MMSNIFNIFSIDWWMDESNNALQMTDSVLFLLLAIPVAYLFLCALFSLGKYKNPYPVHQRKAKDPLPGASRTAPFLSAFYRIAQRERSN